MAEVEINGMKEINVKRMFHEKNPKLAKWIPGFIYRYLKRIIHQDFYNEVIRDFGHIRGHAFSVAIIPALATEIVCCSITSCRTLRAASLILSNSSIQQIPLSDKTSAPLSSTMSRVSGSLVTYAVRPTAEDPRPEV